MGYDTYNEMECPKANDEQFLSPTIQVLLYIIPNRGIPVYPIRAPQLGIACDWVLQNYQAIRCYIVNREVNKYCTSTTYTSHNTNDILCSVDDGLETVLFL